LQINGKVGDLKLVYSGSYLVRNVEQQGDYTTTRAASMHPTISAPASTARPQAGNAIRRAPLGLKWRRTPSKP